MNRRLRHPIPWIFVVLVVLTVLWQAIGAPISLITQIAIYTLYGAGVNLLVGYTGLVPFGASVFFGCASYAVAISHAFGSSATRSRRWSSPCCSPWCSPPRSR